MPLANTDRAYGGVAKTFHWLTALLIAAIIPLGIVANDLPYETSQQLARKAQLFSLHKTLGVTIFFVALARIAWAALQPRPGLLNAEKPLEARLAETVHWLLYGSLVLVPLTGWIHHSATTGFAPIWWPFGQSLPFVPRNEGTAALFAGLHLVLERVLVVAILLHVAGALKHHFIDRDWTLRRMLPGRGEPPVPPRAAQSAIPVAAALGIWLAAIAAGSALGLYAGHDPIPAAAELEEVDSDWTVQDGTLAITVTQLGSPVTGSFADWTAAIAFAPREDPGPAGNVDVTVAIGSLTLGSVTTQALGPDFFAAETHPTAVFAGEIARTETGYVATGPLTIRGETVPITLPFTLGIDGDRATMTGSLTLDRLDFAVGQTMPDESTLGFGVDVTVDLTAMRAE
jgi:cytochrome b561/polyisoprenoid-binding protein YceI